jgi:hypothetical protein
MSAMIQGQIQTGMGRHIEYSQMHPGMLEKSMKVSYLTEYVEVLLRFDMISLAMQKTFYIKLLWGKSAVALEHYMLTRQLRVVKSSILAQYCHIATSHTQRRVVISVWTFATAFCAFVTLVRSLVKLKHCAKICP